MRNFMMRVYCCISMLCMAWTALGLSLKQAQEIMLFKNTDIVIANQEFCKKGYEETEAKAVWYPSLDVVGSYNHVTENSSTTISGLPLPGLAPGSSETLPIPNSMNKTELGVDLTYPLTAAFVNVYNVRYRRLALTVKEAQNQGLKNLLSFKLGAIYLQWNMSYQQTDVYKTLIKQLEEMLNQTAKLKAGGLASSAKVLDVKARLAQAQSDLVTNQNQCDSLKLELLNFIQSPDSGFLPVDYSFAIDSQSLLATDSVGLNTSRPELVSLDIGMEQLAVFQSIISGQKYPNLIALAGLRYANPGLAMGKDQYMGYGLFGLQLKWNLFDGWKVSSQHKQTSEQIDILKTQRQQLIDMWSNAIKNAKLSIKRAEQQADAANASLSASDAYATDAQNNFAAGMATQTDVLNALTAKSKSALLVKQSIFMKNMAVLQLLFASGKELKF